MAAVPSRATAPDDRSGGLSVPGRRWGTLLLALAVILAVMSGSAAGTGSAGAQSAPGTVGRAGFAGHGSIGQAYVLGAPPGANLVLVNADGNRVGGGTVDRLGSLIIRGVSAGAGYSFRSTGCPDPAATAPFRVLS